MDYDTLIERLPSLVRFVTGIHPALWVAALVAVYLGWQYRKSVTRWASENFPFLVSILVTIFRVVADTIRSTAELAGLLGRLVARLLRWSLFPIVVVIWGIVRLFEILVAASERFGPVVLRSGESVLRALFRNGWSFLLALRAAFLRSPAPALFKTSATTLLRFVTFVGHLLVEVASAVRFAILLPFMWLAAVFQLLTWGLTRLWPIATWPFVAAARALSWLLARVGDALRAARDAFLASPPVKGLPLLMRRLAGASATAARWLWWMMVRGLRGLAQLGLSFLHSVLRVLLYLSHGFASAVSWLTGAIVTAIRRGSDALGAAFRAAAASGALVQLKASAGALGIHATNAWRALARAAHGAAGTLSDGMRGTARLARALLVRMLAGLAVVAAWLGRAATLIARMTGQALSRLIALMVYLLRASARGVTLLARPIALALSRLIALVVFLLRAIGHALARAATLIASMTGQALSRLIALAAPPFRAGGRVLARAVALIARLTGQALSRLIAFIVVLFRAIGRGMTLLARPFALALSHLSALGVLALRPAVQAIAAILRLVASAAVFPFRALSQWHARLGLRGHQALNVSLAGIAIVALAFLFWPHKPELRVLAGSGHATFEPILKRWATANSVDVQVTYKGSLDMMFMLQSGDFPYDVIWEADSLWTSLSGSHAIKGTRSIMCSPIVFGIKSELARDLMWVGRRDLRLKDLLAAAEELQLRVMMTSATQSNSGASAYFGFLYAFAGQPDILTAEHLDDPAVLAQAKRLLATIDRSSDSSGWLRDSFVADYPRYDAMFNYESHIIEANQRLVRAGRERLTIIYPREGLGTADFPLSFVAKGNADKEALFNSLQRYLLAGEAQDAIAKKGRRVGPLCDQMHSEVLKAEPDIDPNPPPPFRYPVPDVIWDALRLYQRDLRKPNFTVYALDFSASMEGGGKQQLLQAMSAVLDSQKAKRFLLEASADDVNIVLIFNHGVINADDVANWTVMGNHPADLERLLGKIAGARPAGRTDIYKPVVRALKEMQARGLGGRAPAIILMTDGESNTGSLADIERAIAETGLRDVPVFGIAFGEASDTQLKAIATLTRGRVFDGSKDLISAFRNAVSNR